MERIWKRIIDVRKYDKATAEQLTLKLVEELGEFAETLHWESGYKKTDLSIVEIKENQLEEGCDVIICIMAALSAKGFDYESTIKMMDKKIDKWMRKHGNEI